MWRFFKSLYRRLIGDEYRLCYIEDNYAYFTTRNVRDQWGDDWDDAPYDCNAEKPYEWDEQRGCAPYKILRIHYSGLFLTPVEFTQVKFSVEEINKGMTPWLLVDDYAIKREGYSTGVLAGTTLYYFIKFINDYGGTCGAELAKGKAI